MNNFWYWITNFGSLASLIALPIALIQIHDVKKKLKDSEETTKRFVNRTNREKLEIIEDALNAEHGKLLKLKSFFRKPGASWQNTIEQAEEIVQGINMSSQKLPADCSSIEEKLRASIIRIQHFMNCKEDEREEAINDAEARLHEGLLLVKLTIGKMTTDELMLITTSD